MGLFGPGSEPNFRDTESDAEDFRRKAEKRRKKIIKQENKAKKLAAPISVWLEKFFGPVSIICTIGMLAAEMVSCATALKYYGSVDWFGRLSVTGFTTWTVLGGIWFFACVKILDDIKKGKADEDIEEREDSFKRKSDIVFAVWVVLFALLILFSIF